MRGTVPATGRVLAVAAALESGEMARLLRAHGLSVHDAADGPVALQRAVELEPDVVLLDDELPGDGGLELLDRFKANPELSHIPILFLSERTASEDVAHGLERGAHDYLRKPVDPSEMVARVMGAMRTKGLQDRLRAINAELRLTAGTDALTGLPNRRMAAEQLDRLVSRASRHDLPFALVLADIDHFKLVNDRHGHAVGDAALVAVAQRLRRVCRQADLLARWGGEELVVLTAEARSGGVAVLADRLCRAMAGEPLRAGGLDLSLTLSVGWTAWRSGDDAAALLARADRALYAAKASGRGRACSGDAVEHWP